MLHSSCKLWVVEPEIQLKCEILYSFYETRIEYMRIDRSKWEFLVDDP